jgi:hypothetical protein
MDLSPLISKLASEAGLAITILCLGCAFLIAALKTIYNRMNVVQDKFIEQSTALQIALNNNTNVIDRLREKIEG